MGIIVIFTKESLVKISQFKFLIKCSIILSTERIEDSNCTTSNLIGLAVKNISIKKLLKRYMDSEQSNFGVNFGHNVGEFFEVDKPVSVLIGEVNHLIDFSAIEVLSNTGSNFLEFFRSECSSS
jgi:hypothetical protein